MKARDVLTAARDAHPALDRYSTPDQVALRCLAGIQRQLLTDIARYKKDAVHLLHVVGLPLASFDAGETLNPHILVHGATVVYTATDRTSDDLRLVEYPLRLERFPRPAAYLRAGTLFLLGDVEDWQDVARVEVDLFPRGPDTLARETELVLPGQPLTACAAALAAFLAGRVDGQRVTVPDPAPAVASYLDDVTERRRAKVGTIRDVW